MAAIRHVDRHSFLKRLEQSGLLDPAQWQEAVTCLPKEERGRVVARTLVREGVLTRFQAEQLLAGRTQGFLLGQYRILEQLGQGGMGRVFKAEHRLLGRLVALKVLAPRLLKSSQAQQFFLREVRATAHLVHPNIVAALDANQDGERYYLVMEYVDGPNLDQLVRHQGPLPIGQACDYLRQVAEGLRHAARQGMVHRDIKPANLLVQLPPSGSGESGIVKISDFGLARLSDPTAPTTGEGGTLVSEDETVLGTPDFMAPEQARNIHQADIRSDLYSLGCTFYYLLTGQPPFPGGGAMDKIVRHALEEPTPLEQLRPDVPPAVAAILRGLLAKNPAERFQTPGEVVRALAPHGVATPLAWPPRPVSSPFLDSLATPSGRTRPDAEAVVDRADAQAALAETVPPNILFTPLGTSGPGCLSQISTILYRDRRRRWLFAFLAATGIVCGLMAGAAAYCWLPG
jgi:serine/threonine protein kinase